MIRREKLTEEDLEKYDVISDKLREIFILETPFKLRLFTASISVLIGEVLSQIDPDDQKSVMEDIVEKSWKMKRNYENEK